MCLHKVFYFFILIALTVNFQTANADIGGKVSNQAGNSIANAIVALLVKGINTTTGADGAYSLKIPSASLPVFVSQREQISLNRGVLELSLTHPSPVKVEIFNVKGILLKKEMVPDALAGVYSLNIADNSRAANLLFIHASIGSHEMTFRYLPLQIGKYAFNSSVTNFAPIGGSLAKIAAVVDTLKTAANGFATKMVPISSYDTTVNIALDSAAPGAVTVQLDQTKQTITGFGINNNYGAIDNNGIKACFDSTTGLGLSILRIGMASSGELTGSNNWNEVKNAKAAGCKYFIAATWSPPGSWKSGQKGGAGSENGGGHLNTDKYTAWADRIAAFPAKVKQNAGVDLYGFSPANEPDFASCGSQEPCNGDYATTLYTAEEMVAFIKVVGPKLHAANCKVIAPEASEWIHTWSDTSACCSVGGKKSSDPLKCGFPPTDCAAGKGYNYGHYLYKDSTAWAAVDILGVHQYDTQRAEAWPADVPDRKPVWQTEMSGVKWWPEQGPSRDINNGVAVAGWIHDALVKGEVSAWCYWWYNGSSTNEGLLVGGQDTKRHYTYGNYTKFVRPGYTRVDISGNIPKGVLLSAYKGNGTVVIVAIDSTSAAATVPITIAGGTAPASFTPWVTSANDDLKSKDAVTVTNGTFTATLAGKTVTTFVSK